MAMMDKMQSAMEATLVPVAAKINGQRHVAAVRDAFTLAFPMTLAGSLVMLVNYAVLDPNGFIAKILHLGSLIPNLADYQATLTPILQGTTNIMSLLIVFLTAYKLAETKGGDTLLSAICAVGVFFIIYPPYEESGALPMTFMGAQGLFVAILVGLLVGEAVPALAKNEKLRIKMPDSVPPAVAQSFNLVIPIIIVFVVSGILSFLFNSFTEGGIQYIIYNSIQVPFRSLGNNIFTVLIFALAQQFLWILGIHGPNTLSAIRSVMFAEQGVANLAYYGTTGTTVGCPFPLTWASINDAFGNTGGSGATLGLIIAIFLVARKDKTQMTIGKLALAPGLFNINEPLMFGLPIVMNPIYAIPFIATPLVCNIIGYLCTIVFQIIPPVTLDVGWTTPGFLIPFLGSGGHNVLSLVVGVLCVVVSTLIYMPFVAAAAKANIAKEAESVE
ncbi:PTS sugar transporter subunit IIC [Faecalibacterium gallinarum]|uniref:Permease IIC component n=1 Tax=Faecalibacterium gallinarum TaxID=2903556 RepID=A0AA37MYW4_9FIRM|nr:PTS transporter subunit EIIC [Faecalibacterium gallinarum]GJN64273.1 permease IIC component [Faecalibacterium gallinarum]